MFEQKNMDRNDAIGRQFKELKGQVLPPPALEKATAAGVPYGRRVRTRVHVLRFAKAVAAYVVGIALFLGAILLLPQFWEGNEPVGSDPAGNPAVTTPARTDEITPTDAPTLPEAHFYVTGTVSPEEIAALFGQGYSPELSRWFPVMRIDSTDALNRFCTEAGKILSLDDNAPASFASAINEYDDAYFAENALAIGYFGRSAHSHGYSLAMYSKVGDRITFGVSDYSTLIAPVEAGNLMVVELPRADVEGVETFGGYLNKSNGGLSAADRQAVVEIRFGGTHIFNGSYARKLTEDLAALDYTEPQKTNLDIYSRAQIKTANGSYLFVVTKGEVYQGDLSAKYPMGSILKQIVDHYPTTIADDSAGEIYYLQEEEWDLLAGFAEPKVDGMKPVVRLDSWEELTAFVAAMDEEFRSAEDTSALDAFIASQIEKHGQDYFDGYSLLLTCFEAGSGSYNYYLTDVAIDAEGTLTMKIRMKTNLSETITDDVVCQAVSVRVPTDLLNEVSQYGSLIQ